MTEEPRRMYAPRKPVLSEKWKALSETNRASAVARKCPECTRGAALIKSKVTPEKGIHCRYCGFTPPVVATTTI